MVKKNTQSNNRASNSSKPSVKNKTSAVDQKQMKLRTFVIIGIGILIGIVQFVVVNSEYLGIGVSYRPSNEQVARSKESNEDYHKTLYNRSNARNVQSAINEIFYKNHKYPDPPLSATTMEALLKNANVDPIMENTYTTLTPPATSYDIMYTTMIDKDKNVAVGYCIGYWDFTYSTPDYFYGGSATKWDGTSCL